MIRRKWKMGGINAFRMNYITQWFGSRREKEKILLLNLIVSLKSFKAQHEIYSH